MVLFALIALLFAVPLYTVDSSGEAPPEARSPAAPAPKAATGRASITFTSLQPLTLVGRGFKSGERVRITGAGTRTVVATRDGGFRVRMASRNPCPSLSITAIGSKGSRASMNFSQLLCVEQ
jgi:hypothetical protein